MYEKALVAVDGSKPSLKAVETARELARKGLLRNITLAYVIHIPHPIDSVDGMVLDFIPPGYQKELLGEARKVMGQARDLFPPDCTVEAVIESGPPAETILHMIDKERFDLVIVGHRGLNQLQRLFLGSVSNKIVNLASCTVIVVK
ncbi:MAG: universal stress protein [Firmicutes bacterium]|nr:universal stress protein [Bacillota bacterium]